MLNNKMKHIEMSGGNCRHIDVLNVHDLHENVGR
jgi:hypothetical protein